MRMIKEFIEFVEWKMLVILIITGFIFFPIMLWAFGNAHLINVEHMSKIFWIGVPTYLITSFILFIVLRIKKRKNLENG